jgi:hypothetical protein
MHEKLSGKTGKITWLRRHGLKWLDNIVTYLGLA